MKKISIVSTILAAVVFLAASCDTECIKETYSHHQVNEASFASTVFVDNEIPAVNNSIDVLINRNSADGSLTVPLKNNFDKGVICPTSVTFAAGEYQAAITLDISGMEVGSTYKGTVSIDGDDYFNKGIANSSVACTLAKAYNWVNIGKGKMYDGLALQPSDDDLGIIDIDVYKAEGFDRWRLYNCFPKDQLIAAWGEDYLGEAPTNPIEVYAIGDGCFKFDGQIKTGLTYIGLADDAYIRYYYPEDYSEKTVSYNALNCFLENGTILQFCVARVIENTTSWFNFGTIYVALPTFTGDFEAWLLEE